MIATIVWGRTWRWYSSRVRAVGMPTFAAAELIGSLTRRADMRSSGLMRVIEERCQR